MEEDDDFGELYADVILPSPPSDHPIADQSNNPQIDLNLIPNPNPNSNFTSIKSEIKPEEPSLSSGIRWNLNFIPKQDPDQVDSFIESDTKPVIKVVKEEPIVEDFSTFDIEEEEDGDLGPRGGIRVDEDGDDWDSDSDDDLQIVLDDDKNIGMMEGGEEEGGEGMMMMMGGGEMEEREWGEDGTGGGEGERKEGGDGKGGGGGGGLKIGFSGHAYHPYHSSQFKYVRPGAAPGVAPVGPGQALGQVRPPVGPVAGRGRGGEWRPPGMKGFHSGFAWGNNGSGRGFGSGLDFTLPSHKTIFEVDINGFEEKPWKLAGVDVSDFFNFGLNEESWKDYCKQLEILRMGASMPSKIRVYESGRAEQEYDPDLPPELVAAAGGKEILSENTNAVKIDVVQSDLPKECGNTRLSMPTGRPIQVETGFGERLPSIDSRPNRIRDSDAIIEIVLEGLENDDPVQEDAAIVQPEHDLLREGSGVGHQSEEKFAKESNEHFDGNSIPYRGRERNDFSEGDGTKSFSQEARTRSSPNSRGRSSSHPDKDVGAVNHERRSKSRKRSKSPETTLSRSTQEKKEPGSQKEGSVESFAARRSPHVSSPLSNGSDEELDVELVDDTHDDVSHVRKEKIIEHVDDSLENPEVSLKRQRGSSRVRQSSISREFDDGEESKAVKYVENRISRSGSERDYHKARGNDKITVNMIRSYNDDEHLVNPRNYDERHEMGKRVVDINREDPYSYRDWDPPHGRKERDNPRKRELVRNKDYENERMDKDEYYKLNKHMNNNGSSRVYYEKDMGSQYRGRDDNMKNRFEAIEDPYRKRRKEDENMRRDVEKEEIYHLGRNREYANNRKRERDDAMDPRKREGGTRSRDEGNLSSRYKEEDWVLWERERQRVKHSHEESLPKRERVESRDGIRGGRAIVKDKGIERDYHFKRRDNRVENGYIRGDQVVSDERESKPERDRNRSDLENNRSHHKRHKESSRKGKESEGGERNSMGSSKRSQEVRNGQVKEPAMAKGTTERGNGVNDISKKYKVDVTASSDEDQQDSRKGRSKLERWTSHQERDFATLKKPSSSLLAVKEAERYNSKVDSVDNNDKHLDPEENHLSSGDTKEVGDLETKNAELTTVDDNDNNNNKHLETVEKLKKRSERFKLPMRSEKETVVVKKMENEPLPSTQEEAPSDLEIKSERPARKRRWISS